jgi:hypothetical protein
MTLGGKFLILGYTLILAGKISILWHLQTTRRDNHNYYFSY